MEILKAAWATTCCCCPHPMLLFRISAYLDLISIFPQETVMINFLRRRNMKRHYCQCGMCVEMWHFWTTYNTENI